MLFGGGAGSGKLKCAEVYRYRLEFFRAKGYYPKEEDIPREIMDIESKILTQHGWKILSDIKPGDKIMNPDGSPQTVLKVFENGIKPLYRVTFEDGTSTLAGGEHLWGFWVPRSDSKSKSRQKNYGTGVTRPVSGEWNCDYIRRARVGNTLELKEKLDKNGKILTPICAPQRFAKGVGKGRKMNPYLLGVLLGDGCLTSPQKGKLVFCKGLEDKEIAARLEEEGLKVELDRVEYGREKAEACTEEPRTSSIRETRRSSFAYWVVIDEEQFMAVKSYGLLYKRGWEKFIPNWYKWAPLEYRLALAQGLMDTDGYASSEGRGAHVEYSTSSEQLAKDAVHLFRSLGYIVKLTKKESPTYTLTNGEKREGRTAWRLAIQGNNLDKLFYLRRKKDRCSPSFNGGVSWAGKHIVSIEYELDAYARCLQVAHPNGLYITDDFIVTHNTTSILLDFARPDFISNSSYNGVIFRRTYPEIKNPGGILDESQNLYNALEGNLTLNPLEWKFKSGAKIAFRHLQYEKTKYEYQGSQITRLAFDEVTAFTEEQFFYLLSRNRSTSGIKPQVRATCNPDADSWVAKLVEWYIDEAGFPRRDRAGKMRWFVRINKELIWANTSEELTEKYPNAIPKSFTFIPALIQDNPILLEKDPGYLANLMALHPVERARLLEGNWKIRYEAGTIFNRTWFEVVDTIPESFTMVVRFWDLAATAREVARSTSFYSAGCKVGMADGIFYVLDLITEQRSPGELDELIVSVAAVDSPSVRVRWELEGGSAGKLYEQQLIDKLLTAIPALDAKAEKPLGDKVTRAIPIANAAAEGKVKLLRASWNDKFLNAVSSFDGSPQPLTNDIVDSLDGAIALLKSIPVYDYSGMGLTKKR